MEDLVRDGIFKVFGIYVIGRADAGNAYRMRSHAINGFQVFGMHQQSYKIIAVCIQAEQDSHAYIIDSSLHGTVHGLGMIGIVAFRSGGMQLFVILFMICLLKEDICTDTCIFQLAIILYRSGGNVHVYPADSSVFMMDTVDGTD